ncbi:hypothetical protein TWF481_009742 [Arthrobotrys musiformis]|uniref:Uncharacterized protein n=1 Tax=Arthrobotrys musiformis TaxID=47236 RepID=A0AAV9W5U0_9PEZI
MSNPTNTLSPSPRDQSPSSSHPLLTIEIPPHPTSTIPSPLFYTSDDSGADDEGDELIYPHEYGDSEDDSHDETEDGDIAVLYGTSLNLGLAYPAGIDPLEDQNPRSLRLITNFDDSPVGLRKGWAEQYVGFEEGDEGNDDEDSENLKVEIATVGRVFRANSAALVDINIEELQAGI